MRMNAEARRGQLLECARALFFSKGYEETTVNDIMEMAGVSKGGFYHHFRSKEEALEALSRQLAEDAVERVRDVLADGSRPALERLNEVLRRLRGMKREDAAGLLAAYESAYRPENLVLYHRLHHATKAVWIPVLGALVEQGRAEGVFDVVDGVAAAEVILQLGAMTQGAVGEAIAARGGERAGVATELLEDRLRQQGIAVDRILGVPDGSVALVEPGFVEALLAAESVAARAVPA